MTTFKEVVSNGKTQGIITVEFNVGEIIDEKKELEGGGMAIAVTMDTEWALGFYSQRLFELAQEGNQEAFNEHLELYRQHALLDTIGLVAYPLKRTFDGELVGLKESIENI